MNILIKNISIKIASPNKIINWSYGEIKNSNFINYKSLKPEINGLFCLKIFSIYNICCDKKRCECGKNNKFLNLKKSHSSYRFGHLLLFYPVVHMWFLKTVSNNVSCVINLTNKVVDKIINFKIKIVIKSFVKKFKKYSIILNNKKEPSIYYLSGAKAIDKLLSDNELLLDCLIIKKKILNCNSINNLFKYLDKISKIYLFYLSGNKPNWFCIKILPIVSPKIRPLIPLSTGKFATSDLNELYRKIISRNLRLKNVKLLGIPKQILINERILLQESVNSLFDNEKTENPILTSSKRVLKSFSSSIKGKYGRFRQNLLGKRVDFSGRTVISVEPNLHLYQCGLPILIGLELFKPFIYCELKKKNLITNISFIDNFYSKNKKISIKILKKICDQKSILLNRAPTLHRMGIQSFKILLTQDKTIKLHPLVCLSYNADFDGDQMAIHLPLTINAQVESNYLLLSMNNIISPSNGEPIIIPTQDIVMGIYCLTFNYNYDYIIFYHINEVLNYFNINNSNFLQNIILKFKNFFLKTTIGRIILYFSLLKKINIKFLNKNFKKKKISYIIKYFYDFFGLELTTKILDKLKKIGFFFSTFFGITISYYDLISIKSNFCILKLIKKIKIKSNIFDIVNTIESLFLILLLKKISPKKNKNINNVFIMLDSGSRGSMLQIKQLLAFRGFFSKSNGDIIIEPILDNLKNGLSMRNFFISSFGARKGLTDTSLKTANSGYLTRKLVDVLQDVVIYKINCNTKIGIKIFILKYKKIFLLYKKIYGRILFDDIFIKNKLLIKKNTFINNKIIFLIIKKKIKIIHIRSVIHCISSRGICSFCYGSDLSTTKLIQLGTPIGIIAAQSIGEPGTQLTMRTFHTGGVASFTFTKSMIVTNNFGYVYFKNCKCLLNYKNELIILNNFSFLIIKNFNQQENYKLSYGEKILIRNGIFIKKKIKIKNLENNFCIYSENVGYFFFNEILKKRFCESDQNYYYKTFKKTTLFIKNKKLIKKYFIPKDFFIIKEKFDFIMPGDVIAKMQFLFIFKSSIIGGLPRLSELFEARIPKKKAILSEIDGIVKIKINNKNNFNIVIITKYGFYNQYILENSRKLYVNNGDYVKIGDILSDGKPDLNDVIKLIGLDYLIFFFIKEINDIYQPQGIFINDKHIELVLRQMTKKVRILYSGECFFIQNDILYLEDVLTENVNTLKFSKKVSLYERVVFGITKVSLDSSSFFSAASFQETSKILIDSAIRNRVDYLLGLKENVVIGGLIPAGTGLTRHIFLLKKNKDNFNNLKKNLKFYIKNDFKSNN
ncbi:DNA-directed RNA polymerase subunit beta' [Candidatus Carsonella ruddii]|uniref:DNA-directed RNA polymerase subunit beta' n=3 Tax=cellular organisms TaxID=131567 RepID=A0AAJ6FD36_CARRU|nr:DNA-directed RNA polymerase subunit beta' [Candidatus Carsonella ruddii]WGS66845.1 DNA-directed RNA polymerase subunit beta' [Candidatus Carsonella ruddii]WGS67037.1 DNA-directed RNA polymerase subunit beta' [Candidatus Carsonella ruddii]WGS67229.1 DNA-directed RNA polymerase subunit beta' [Candidatus Carsonella ruddii]WMC18246.1 MAG: DNA-directed RNA polymerase subunit beta' [Candidatus Carsonella ruddii]WMC18440.1 MAG: DNA-directed RNA polymerase subunit beta' [Candidatus Carsonella ruddi